MFARAVHPHGSDHDPLPETTTLPPAVHYGHHGNNAPVSLLDNELKGGRLKNKSQINNRRVKTLRWYKYQV